MTLYSIQSPRQLENEPFPGEVLCLQRLVCQAIENPEAALPKSSLQPMGSKVWLMALNDKTKTLSIRQDFQDFKIVLKNDMISNIEFLILSGQRNLGDYGFWGFSMILGIFLCVFRLLLNKNRFILEVITQTAPPNKYADDQWSNLILIDFF